MVLDLGGGGSAAALLKTLQRADPEAPVSVIVPAWFSVADRHHVAAFFDPDDTRQIALVSSTLVSVYGHHLGTIDESSMETVLSIDLRRGWSGGLVRVAPTGITEVASWGAGPHEPTGHIDDETSSTWLIDHLLTAASTVPGMPAVSAVLVAVDDGVAAGHIRRAVQQTEHTQAPFYVKRGRQLMAKGVAAMRGEDGSVPAVGTLARGLSVLADEDPEQPAMRVVAAEHAPFPSSTRLTFDLGPDDGAPLHFDVYEQDRASDGENVKGRAVLRAHLVRERGYDRSMVVTFELRPNGLFTVTPAKAWSLEWEQGSVDFDPATSA